MSLKNICRLSVCLVALFLLASRVAAAVQAESPFQFEGGNQYDISNLTETFVLRLPLTVKPAESEVTPQLSGVSVGGLRDASLVKFFKVTMDKVEGNAGGVRVLVVTVYVRCWEQDGRCLKDSEKGPETKAKVVALAQGEYVLLLDMQTAPPLPSPPPDLTKLTLKLAPAQLDVPATLSIRQEVPFWGEPVTTGSLPLTQKPGGKTTLTDIRIQQFGVAGDAAKTTPAELKFDNPPSELGPTGSASALVTPSSAFPLGETSGKVVVLSPQLSQPQLVNYKVTAWLPRWVIVAFIVAGLIFSYLVRIWSVQRIERNEARVKAAADAATLSREMAARADEVFVKKVEPEYKKLLAITSRTTAKEIQDLVAAAKTALDAAVKDFERRRTEAQTLFESLSKVTMVAWQLPAPIVAPLAESRQAVEAAGLNIEGGDIVAAKKALDAEVAGLGAKLSRPASGWRTQTKSFLYALNDLKPLLHTNGATALEQEVTNVNMTYLDVIVITGNGDTVTQVEVMLDALYDARLRARELAESARRLLKSSRVSIAKAQSATPVPPRPELIAALVERFDKFQASLSTWVEQPEAGAEELPSALSELKAAWRQAMLAQVEGDTAAHKRVEDLFESGKFVEATEAAILAFPKGDTILGDVPAADTAHGLGVRELFEALRGSARHGAPSTTVFHTVRERVAAPQLEALWVLSLRELALLRLGRFIIAAAIITYGGWLLFADRVGTSTDLVAIFVWAFGMNFSVDAVLDGQEIKKIVKVEKT